MYTSHISKQILANSCNSQADMRIADRSENFSLKKFSKDIQRFAIRRPNP
jgi:hypothetical protein